MVKITDTKSINQIGKTKKSSKSGKTSGVSFDAVLEGVQGTDAVEATESVAGADAVDGIDADARGAFDVPDHAEERGEYMLEVLGELEQDILSGNRSVAIEKLRRALDTKAIDIDAIPEKLRVILEEIELRAALEIAKLEESSK